MSKQLTALKEGRVLLLLHVIILMLAIQFEYATWLIVVIATGTALQYIYVVYRNIKLKKEKDAKL